MPKLKAVFYAAGNVKAFAPSLIENGITLMSAWAINAIPPAEMCLSQILLSLRGYFRTVRQYREHKNFEAKKYWRPGVQGRNGRPDRARLYRLAAAAETARLSGQGDRA